MSELPRAVDTLILGGGTTGAVIAGRLAERSDETILVVEAGPDHGAFDGGRWPDDLLDARTLAISHAWGYDSGSSYADRVVAFDRARVIGGCSSHNGCAAIWGWRGDYDAWAAAGNDGWSTNDLLPFFSLANERMRVRQPAMAEATPFQALTIEAAEAAGIPHVDNLNDVDEPVGMGLSPVNISEGVRWNSALAYLDPVRHKGTVTVAGNTIADRLLIQHGRVVGARLIGPDGPVEVDAGRTIVSAGTYGSPAILLRSGIGDPESLRAIGVSLVHVLPGVGRNLHDHPMTVTTFAGTPELVALTEEAAMRQWTPEEQTIAKARSTYCDDGFDLHFLPVVIKNGDPPFGWYFSIPIACMTPKSRGRLTLASTDPETAPLIDHNYLGDPAGHDRAVLIDGIRLMREIVAQEPIGAEINPGTISPESFVDTQVVHYYHPAGTCKMGPSRDPDAVVSATGAIHGLTGGYVADCSIMPVVPRANSNIPAIVVGERIAALLP